jgi:N-acetylglutamate synthase-like GNAT family acetyltransferase
MNFRYDIRLAKPGEELDIHTAHMRSIREICIKHHSAEEIRGWASRELADHWTQEIRDKLLWVVEVENKIEGLMALRKYDQRNFLYLLAMYLTPKVSGHKIGESLLDLCEIKAKELNFDMIKLDSSLSALNFYLRNGFIANGERRAIMIGGFPVTSIPLIKRIL